MSLRGLSYYEQHFLFSNRLVQLIIGLRPEQTSIQILFIFFMIVVYVLPMILHQLYQLFMSDIKILLTADLLQKILGCLSVICTYSTIYFCFATVKMIFSHLKFDYEQLCGDDQFEIMNRYMKESKFCIILIVCICNFYFISITIPSVFNVFLHIFGLLDDIHLTLPLPVNNIVNGGLFYYSLLIYQIIAIFIILILTCVCYSTYWIFVQHACMQFSLIVWKIRKPFKNNQDYIEMTSYSIKLRDEFDWIVDIIKHHSKVTEYVDLINNCSKIIYLFAIFFAMILIIFDFIYIFQLSTIVQNISKTIECGITITESIFIIYINFYIGQMLMNHSNETFEELCQVPFYVLSIRTQKLLLLVITKSMRPCELSIGGMFVVSHELFAGLMQKALSFAMIYYNML